MDTNILSIEEMNDIEQLKAIAGPPSGKGSVSFKSPAVRQEFQSLNPTLKAIAEMAPMGGLVTSGARSPQENAMVGGVSNSAHMDGNAIDFRIDENTPQRQQYYKDLGMKAFVHGKNPHLHTEGTPDIDRMSVDQLKALAGPPVQAQAAQAATTPKPTNMESTPSQILSASGALGFIPGQLYNAYNQQQGLSKEVNQPGQFNPLTSAGMSAINAPSFGHLPDLLAAIQMGKESISPDESGTQTSYGLQKKKYQGMAEASAKERPFSSGVGSEVGMQVLGHGLNKFIPSYAIKEGLDVAPDGFFSNISKMAADLGKGALTGGASGVAGTYGINPSDSISLEDRVAMAAPSIVAGGVSQALPRAGSLIGRQSANKKVVDATNEPRRALYESDVANFETRKQEVQSFNEAEKLRYQADKAKALGQKSKSENVNQIKKQQEIDNLQSQADMVQRNRFGAWEDLESDPKFSKSTVNLEDTWKQATDKYKGIIENKKVDANRTADEKAFVKWYENTKGGYTKYYGKDEPPKLKLTVTKEGTPVVTQEKQRSLQTSKIPFSEAAGTNKVINEGFGSEGYSNILSTLKKSLTEAMETSGDPEIVDKFKRANALYGREKDILNKKIPLAQKQKTKAPLSQVKPPQKKSYGTKPSSPEYMENPQAQMPPSAQSIHDIADWFGGFGTPIKSPMESMYTPRLAPTASETMLRTAQPYLKGLGDLITLATAFGQNR